MELAARCGASGRWDLATELLRRELDEGSERKNQDKSHVSEKYAISLLRGGDRAAYQAHQNRRFSLFVAGNLRVLPPKFLWECLLAPGGLQDPDALIKVAEEQVTSWWGNEVAQGGAPTVRRSRLVPCGPFRRMHRSHRRKHPDARWATYRY